MHQINNFNRLTEINSAYSTGNVNLLFYNLPKNFCDEYKSYEAPRLCTIIEGKKEVSINQSENFTYKKDSFILLPPHSNVYMYLPENTKALVYEFEDQLIDEVSQKVSEKLNINLSSNINYRTFLLETMTTRINVITKRIQDIILEKDLNMNFLIDLTSQEIVYELLKKEGCYEIIHHHQNHPINKAIRIMNSEKSNYMSISDIAEEVNMSLSNFSQQFKMIMDENPTDYITELRLHKSKKLLKSLSVTDTAYELGYENISYFIKIFKKKYDITPKQYQMSLNHIK